MRVTGESVTDAVVNSLRDRLQRVSGRSKPQTLCERLSQILDRVDRLPDIDKRSAEEILGYDETGVPR
jgi:antitoxin VapB